MNHFTAWILPPNSHLPCINVNNRIFNKAFLWICRANDIIVQTKREECECIFNIFLPNDCQAQHLEFEKRIQNFSSWVCKLSCSSSRVKKPHHKTVQKQWHFHAWGFRFYIYCHSFFLLHFHLQWLYCSLLLWSTFISCSWIEEIFTLWLSSSRSKLKSLWDLDFIWCSYST